MVGSALYQGALTGKRYVGMLIATPCYLGDLNLRDRQQIYFQQDGPTAHKVCHVELYYFFY